MKSSKEGGCSADILLGGQLPPLREAFNLEHPEKWTYWSASSSPLCVEFVSHQPKYVHLAIRVLKAWRNELGIRKSRFRPSSFLLELLCIDADRELRTTQQKKHKKVIHPTAGDVFWQAMNTLAGDAEAINIYWTDNYALDMIPPMTFATRPLVLDPCQPYNNIVIKDNFKWAKRHAVAALKARSC